MNILRRNDVIQDRMVRVFFYLKLYFVHSWENCSGCHLLFPLLKTLFFLYFEMLLQPSTSESSMDGFLSLFLNLSFWLEKIMLLEMLSFEPPDISRCLLVWLWNFGKEFHLNRLGSFIFFFALKLFEIRLQVWLYSFVPRITQHQHTLEIWMVRDDGWNLTQKSIM